MRLDEAKVLETAKAAHVTSAVTKRALACLDLTSLNGDESEGDIQTLVSRACENKVAAICVYPDYLPLAQSLRSDRSVALATVVNFPHGGDDILATSEAVSKAVEAGADEVDIVAPLDAILEGDIGLVGEMVQACRDAVAPTTKLKLILETGRLERAEIITAAARVAVMAGIDFLKTSTGKVPVGATPEAALSLLAVIHEADGRVGLKLSGGIRTAEQAAFYLSIADQVMGSDWATTDTFRFGASSLLVSLLGQKDVDSNAY